MPPEIQRLTDQFLHNPVRIEVSRPGHHRRQHHPGSGGDSANDWAKRECAAPA